MSLEGIPGISPTLQRFVGLVREYHRDYPELNRLVKDVETSDRQLAWSVLDAVSRFNMTPPPLGQHSLEQLLGLGHQYLLLRLTTICVLESVILLQMRNHINYSDGGQSVGINDKTPLLRSMLDYFVRSTDQLLGQVKISMNINQILGPQYSGVHSEYWAINTTYLP